MTPTQEITAAAEGLKTIAFCLVFVWLSPFLVPLVIGPYAGTPQLPWPIMEVIKWMQ